MIYPYNIIMDVILRVHCAHTAIILRADYKLGEYRVKVLYNTGIPIKVSVFKYINKLYLQVGIIKPWSYYNKLENKHKMY